MTKRSSAYKKDIILRLSWCHLLRSETEKTQELILVTHHMQHLFSKFTRNFYLKVMIQWHELIKKQWQLFISKVCRNQLYPIPLMLVKYLIEMMLVISVTNSNPLYPSSETTMLGFLHNTFFPNEYNLITIKKLQSWRQFPMIITLCLTNIRQIWIYWSILNLK